MNQGELVESLQAVLKDISVVSDPTVLETYSRDHTNRHQYDGLVHGLPIALVRAETTAQVQATVKWCAEHNISVIPRGAGTGVSGGAVASENTVILSVEKMKAVHIDPVSKIAIVEPGVINADVKRAAAQYGLWYPPDPSSYEICSIGGNINTNAGGLCCVKYGVTIDYVLGLEVVLANGELIKVGGPRLKDSAGYSLTKLFVGSEGTLGIVTQATLKLIHKTAASATLVAEMPSVVDAVRAVVDICGSSSPQTVEFMDKASINIVEDDLRMGLNRDAEALLIIQTDLQGSVIESTLHSWEKILQSHHALDIIYTQDREEAEAFLTARRHFFLAAEKKGSVLYDDVGVDLKTLPTLIEKLGELSEKYGLPVATVAHAGDGNTHPTIVYDAQNAEEAERAKALYGEIMTVALSLNGTITGEHGVGRLKAPWLEPYLGPRVYALQKSIKHLFDPQGILNPGTMFQD